MILFEDKDIIVCRKPAGVPVQSARLGQMDMVSMLNNYLAKPESVRVVHRLDQPVEGVVVFAKTKRAAAGLGKQITDGGMRKVYRAVCCELERAGGGACEGTAEDVCEESAIWQDEKAVEGVRGKATWQTEKAAEDMRKSEQGEWASRNAEKSAADCAKQHILVDYLIKDGRTNTSFVTEKGKKEAKRAELAYRILDAAEIGERRYLLAEIELKTGRHHQIRVQMAHAGLPLYGDQKYNAEWAAYQLAEDEIAHRHGEAACTVKTVSGTAENAAAHQSRENAENYAEKRSAALHRRKNSGLALCAVSLTFTHPVTGKRICFEAEPEHEAFEVFKRLQ